MRQRAAVPRRRRAVAFTASAVASGSLAIAAPAAGQQVLTRDVVSDPDAAVFVYSDVENFVRALERIEAGADTIPTLQREYFDRASPGLEMFVEKYDLTLERLRAAMAKRPAEYRRVVDLLPALQAREPKFRSAYGDIRNVVPGAVFPPTYFLVAGYRGIGSGSIEGPLLSIEKQTPESIAAGDLESTLVHEMIHMQQLAATGEAYFDIFSGPGSTLLARSIREGGAAFFSRLITGGGEEKNAARDYYLAHELELWPAFEADMLGSDTGDWLWQTPSNPDQPQDVGYAIGALIVEAYYETSPDKSAAAAAVMGVTDYEAFLALSGYPDRSP